MSRYRRAKVEGGTFFFTVTLADRSSNALVQHIDLLRAVYRRVRQHHPFETVAICVLPDHPHAIWTLADGDADFARRWSLIKRNFSYYLPSAASRSASKVAKREKGIWQRRYWEHAIRDDTDLARHIDYIHFNLVKHRLVKRVCDLPHSSFHRYVAHGLMPVDWGGYAGELAGAFGE